ncbi:MAG: alpha/beta hydrolase fold-domain containing protein [Gammaproteobacteria bacterium]|nr:alpha/beta hydrolase fold-domain containing protein [Gammaproteobacteria bacterium]
MSKFWVRLLCFVLLASLTKTLLADPKCPNVPKSIGQCVDVGAYQLFVNVQGNTGPVVVFESGRGNTGDTWNQVVPLVAQFARAVTYDRVNLGYSQSQPDANSLVTAKQIAENLHALLHAEKLVPPYILVGHSDGGLYIQMFARLYPKEVSGAVFIDAASPNQAFSGSLPPKTDPAYCEALGFKTSQAQVKQAPPFPHIPIIVLTASYHGSMNPSAIFHMISETGQSVTMTEKKDQYLWEGYQNQLAKLSPNSMHIYAYGSDHYIQKFQPNLVVDAVYTLIKGGH